MIDLPTLADLVHRQHGRCFYCPNKFWRPKRPPTIDHKIPIWAGGRDTADNRVAACKPCNELKGPLDAETFLAVRNNPELLARTLRQVEATARCRANAARRPRHAP